MKGWHSEDADKMFLTAGGWEGGAKNMDPVDGTVGNGALTVHQTLCLLAWSSFKELLTHG